MGRLRAAVVAGCFVAFMLAAPSARAAFPGWRFTPATEHCTPDDVSSTLFQLLGINPQQELQTASGRPIQLFREGRVVEKLLA